MIQAGYSKIDITPADSVPLAGYFTFRPRYSTETLDKLYARILSLFDGENRVVILCCDLLMITADLFNKVAAAIPNVPPSNLFLHATHTHSSFGGVWDIPGFKIILGPYNEARTQFLVDKLTEATQRAIDDEKPSEVMAGKTKITGLTSNRSIYLGETDDHFLMVRFKREKDKIELYNYAGHPVVVAEYDPLMMSGDYPAYFMDKIEENQPDTRTLSLIGSLGATSVLFPEFKMPLDTHLKIITSMLFEGRTKCMEKSTVIPLDNIVNIKEEYKTGPRNQKLFYHGQKRKPKDFIFYFLHFILSYLFKKTPRSNDFPLHIIQLNNISITGFPLDTGSSIINRCRELHSQEDFPIFASQTNDYYGYLHLDEMYKQPFSPNKDQKTNAIYENMMTVVESQFGNRLVNEYERIIKSYA